MVSAGRTRARRGEGGRLAEEILFAAEALLVETGDEQAVTVRAVARRVGVTTPSVYLHYADKAALLDAVCLKVWGDLDERLTAATVGVTDPLDALRRCGMAYVRFGLDHPVQYRLLMMGRPLTHGERCAAAATTAARAALRQMSRAVQDCVDAGVFRGETRPLALSLWAAIHGCVSLLLSKPELDWPPVEDFVDHTVRMAGLGTALISRVAVPGGSYGSAAITTELDRTVDRLHHRQEQQ
ncbi:MULTISPECIES: TetR/AcrR family transcriptional regulator [Protofrankia]|uniref:TetR family transcriptional regulator n=1 Tax=Protofrankia coriariae TaxID=1562887 RepID=A0ABR5F364_9ACTN|nr:MULTISPECIES: TetR/AcrR family transcriptional regulator [Protofrankia]KLL11159.1 TetR family transcriptional regulator [Protofrankia coriariae]ONH35814.1 TetR family transcriptional regulator [Protofrankia sp. BMG5.30]